MANITYLLGAGASYQACPILNNLANAMIALSSRELNKDGEINHLLGTLKYTNFDELKHFKTDKQKILWYINYFGKKAHEFGTIDTYAKRLSLSDPKKEYELLKMSVSIFFDLWENFPERYVGIVKDSNGNKLALETIDKRYIALLSLFLERINTKVQLNNSIKFISWNYDLQLERAFKAHLRDGEVNTLSDLNQYYFNFREDGSNVNDVFHLNGHRGYYLSKGRFIENSIVEDFDGYWNEIDFILKSVNENRISFDNSIKYAWENNKNIVFENNLKDVLINTEYLIVIGYSFPDFNRAKDIKNFSFLNKSRVKEIVFQDPNADEETIKQIFSDPNFFKGRFNPNLRIINQPNKMNKFYVPNEFLLQ